MKPGKVALLAAGSTNELIAERFVVSVRTVDRHLSNIDAKLRLSGRPAHARAAPRFIADQPPGRHGR